MSIPSVCTAAKPAKAPWQIDAGLRGSLLSWRPTLPFSIRRDNGLGVETNSILALLMSPGRCQGQKSRETCIARL